MRRSRFRILATTALALAALGPAHADPATPPSAGGAPTVVWPGAEGSRTYTLAELIRGARERSPLSETTRSGEQVAAAGIVTARALPNPELSAEPGRLVARTAGVEEGSSTLWTIGVPIENPWMRSARLRTAESAVDVARARTRSVQTDLSAAIRVRFFEIARLEEAVIAFREDLQLTEQILERIRLRVRTGEAPRFDLLRAESETAVARKNLESTQMRVLNAKADLRRIVGPWLEPSFGLRLEPADQRRLTDEDFRQFAQTLEAASPEIALARAELEQAQRQVEFERNAVLPLVTLRASQERDPTFTLNRVGAVVTVPLVNRREGPIAEAQARAERARLALEQRRFEASAELEAAWRAYRSTQVRVDALEAGIIDRARAVVDIAEAAYRFGERGIIEFLDAQRQFRLVRNELIAARNELQLARTDLERIAGR